ncbi:hypothetical protein M422DRAFT_127544, partial [Sphaerobolus stellatus SS14]
RSTYGATLLTFHIYCDSQDIPESRWCPVDTMLLLSFTAACAGSYSGSALFNNIHVLQVWHILHGAPWAPAGEELKAVLTGAAHLAPAS